MLATRWKSLIRRIASAAAIGVVLLAQAAGAQSFTDVYVFGDSLSDTGNGCSVLAIAGYKPGRCSNGDVWSEQFAESLGLEAEASALGGTNFAFGGDEAADLDTQIFVFSLTIFPGSADPDALYVIWLGGNDVLGIPSSPTAMQDAVDDIMAGIQDLQSLGAQHFLVPNLPDIGRAFGSFEFPQGSGSAFTPLERDQVTALSFDGQRVVYLRQTADDRAVAVMTLEGDEEETPISLSGVALIDSISFARLPLADG